MKHLRLSCFTLILFFSFSTCLMSIPLAFATKTNNQDSVLTILNNIADFNPERYTATLKSEQTCSFKTLPEQTLTYTLTSNQEQKQAICSFIGSHLQELFISNVN
jgi:hypothetical protein